MFNGSGKRFKLLKGKARMYKRGKTEIRKKESTRKTHNKVKSC